MKYQHKQSNKSYSSGLNCEVTIRRHIPSNCQTQYEQHQQTDGIVHYQTAKISS